MANPGELSGKVAIVTGAGQGMGRAVAERLAAAGARLVVDDLDIRSAERTASNIRSNGGDALAVAANVASREDVRRMVESAVEHYSMIHILVNNAGILRPTPVIDSHFPREFAWGSTSFQATTRSYPSCWETS